MTKIRLYSCLLALLSLPHLAPPSSAAATAETGALSIDFFYNTLAPSGRWIEVENYGPCFQPTVAQTNADWRPYTDGYWSYTDGGWTWVSYEDFGWATYHYGRWLRVNDYGWTWVPGTEWAPAWVAWREGSGGGESGSASTSYIGWAPLPPPEPAQTVRVDSTIAVDAGAPVYYPEPRYYGPDVEVVYGFGPAYWNFCETRYFGAPLLASVLIVPTRNFEICGYTRNITNVYYVNRGLRRGVAPYYFNGGPNFVALRGRTDRPIQQLRLQRQTQFSPAAAAYRVDTARGALVAPAPRIVRGTGAARPIAPNLVQARAERSRIDRGGAPVGVGAATPAGAASFAGRAERSQARAASQNAAVSARNAGRAERVAAAHQAQVERRAQLTQRRQATVAQRQSFAAERRNRVSRSERGAFRAERRTANMNRRASAAPRARVTRAAPQREVAAGGGGRKKKQR